MASRRAMVAAGLAAAIVAGASQQAHAQFLFGPFGTYGARDPFTIMAPEPIKPRRIKHRHSQAKKDGEKKEQAEKLKGPLLIVVSVGNQSVTLYANGSLVARSAVSTGMQGYPTPMGVFTVIQKDRYHLSNIYSLAPMPYMQRITWSGVALHAGVLPGHPASHGCIRLTYDFARRLWGITRTGARVIVARSEVAPAEIQHPRLFAPKPRPPGETPVAEQRAPDAIAAAAKAPEPAGALRSTELVDRADPRKTSDASKAPEPTMAAANGAVPRMLTAEKTDAPSPRAPDATADGSKPDDKPAAPASPTAAPKATPRRSGTMSVFVSRKAGKLFVRQGNEPLFSTAVTIKMPERPFGTHVFTAMEIKDDGAGMRWTVASLPAEIAGKADAAGKRGKQRSRQERDEERSTASELHSPQAAVEALDRIEIPQDAVERIAELLAPGSSFIISDQAISGETGSGTDFIILTH